MNTQEFLDKTREAHVYCEGTSFEFEVLGVRPPVTMADGYHVSIQASDGHYCEPRSNDLGVKYVSVELGFPSVEDELINEYAEDPECYTGTVYGWVPIEVVDQLIEKHGGIVKIGKKVL